MYRALYRKWRPQRFADVVGQTAIVTALQNQIAAGRIGHAYLFTGTRGTGKVYIVFPAKTFAVRGGEAKFEPMPQDQVRLCQGSLDKAFAHPHVYNSGHPCWHDGARSGVADFIATLLETLTMINVTNTSVTYGKCASGVMGVGQDAVRNASIQTKRVYAAFRPLPIVKDRVKLTRYVNNRWITIVSHFM